MGVAHEDLPGFGCLGGQIVESQIPSAVNRFRRIAALCGPQKANVAIQPSMLTAIWHIGHPGALYHDPGADYFTRRHPERAKTRALHQLEAMGYRVTPDRAN